MSNRWSFLRLTAWVGCLTLDTAVRLLHSSLAQRTRMKTIPIGDSPLRASRLAYGCWRIAERDAAPGSGRRAVLAAVDAGYTLVDPADI